MFNPFGNRCIPPVSVHLGPSRQTGAYLVLNHIARDFLFEFLNKKRPLRTRSHQAHVPYEDIEELRSLIDTGLAYKMPHRRHSRVVGGSPLLLLLTRILYFHGTELVHLKRMIVKPNPLLAEEHRTRRRNLNQHCRQQHDR